MAIKVNLADGNAEVGGEFNSALAFVKSFDGRKYDAAVKTWTVPVKLAEFLKRAEGRGLPTEYSGAAYPTGRRESGHQTRYGNRYDNSEWAAMGEARQAGSAAGQAMQEQVEAAEKALREAQMAFLLKAVEGNAQVAEQLYRSFVGFNARWLMWSVEEVEAAGAIQFSSPARREAVIKAVEAARDNNLLKGVLQAWQDQEDARVLAEQEIYEKYGVFQ